MTVSDIAVIKMGLMLKVEQKALNLVICPNPPPKP